MAIKTQEDADKALVEAAQLKSDIKQMEEDLTDVQTDLIEWLDDKNQKTLSVSTASGKVKGTVVRGSRMVLDESRLKKLLGARLFNKATKRVIDKKKLEDLIARSEIQALDVAACTDENFNRPYIKITKR